MNYLDQIKELEQQKQAVVTQAHDEALNRAELAIKDLNALGFKYKLTKTGTAPKRTGIRQQVLQTIKTADGLTPAAICETLNLTDTKGKTAVTNALTYLKSKGEVTVEDGVYR